MYESHMDLIINISMWTNAKKNWQKWKKMTSTIENSYCLKFSLKYIYGCRKLHIHENYKEVKLKKHHFLLKHY